MASLMVHRSCGAQLEYFLVTAVPRSKVLGVLLSSLLILLPWKLCTRQLLTARVTQQTMRLTGILPLPLGLFGCRLGLAPTVYGLSGLFRK